MPIISPFTHHHILRSSLTTSIPTTATTTSTATTAITTTPTALPTPSVSADSLPELLAHIVGTDILSAANEVIKSTDFTAKLQQAISKAMSYATADALRATFLPFIIQPGSLATLGAVMAPVFINDLGVSDFGPNGDVITMEGYNWAQKVTQTMPNGAPWTFWQDPNNANAMLFQMGSYYTLYNPIASRLTITAKYYTFVRDVKTNKLTFLAPGQNYVATNGSSWYCVAVLPFQ